MRHNESFMNHFGWGGVGGIGSGMSVAIFQSAGVFIQSRIIKNGLGTLSPFFGHPAICMGSPSFCAIFILRGVSFMTAGCAQKFKADIHGCMSTTFFREMHKMWDLLLRPTQDVVKLIGVP